MNSSLSSSHSWDSIVVGGGSAGLSAALMLGRARRRVLVVDAGSPRNRFAAHMHAVLGNDGTPPSALLAKGRAELAEYDVAFVDDAVARVQDADAGLLVTLAGGRVESARSLIVATGITDVLPDIPGLAERWGASVLHCPYCHGWEVRDRRLGVLATSPPALHQARMVRQWADRVVLFSAGLGVVGAADERRLRARGVEIVPDAVVEVLGEGDQVSGARLEGGRVIELDALFTAGAPLPRDGFLADLALARSELPGGLGSFLAVDQSGRTSHPRIWAAGNVVNPMVNVPIAMGAGAMVGAAVNGALVEEDFDLAVAEVDRATGVGAR
ncbi:NAD(P)/FAD-dependent oxidoreductase [Microbacterium sp.]|uniref:NAD(P)/FAD-dependent oxidoreductase n=1 Tax=Microbacterium sp. TaxID=51671 RepID=UPI002811C67F|nr:NAD(P)/FAD-dependent oxidoreductase [Microbacterium sp.]